MKSNSTTALTLYPFLRQIKMRRSTAEAVTKGIEATGLPCIDQPKSTVALGMRLRVIGALSRLCSGLISFCLFCLPRQVSARIDGINNVNPTKSPGCQIPKR